MPARCTMPRSVFGKPKTPLCESDNIADKVDNPLESVVIHLYLETIFFGGTDARDLHDIQLLGILAVLYRNSFQFPLAIATSSWFLSYFCLVVFAEKHDRHGRCTRQCLESNGLWNVGALLQVVL